MKEQHFNQKPSLAICIGDKHIMIQEYYEGYEYSLIGADYRTMDGGFIDTPNLTIWEALKEAMALHGYEQCGEWKEVDYEALLEKVCEADDASLFEKKEDTKMSVMSFDVFVDKVKGLLLEKCSQLEEPYEVIIETVCKANETYTGLSLVPVKTSTVTALIHCMEQEYSSYIKGKPVAQIANDIFTDVGKADAEIISFEEEVKNMCQFDFAKDRLFFKVINKEFNEEFLKKVPHKVIHDLALFCAIKLKDKGDIGASVNVTWKLMEEYQKQGIDVEMLFACAKESATKNYPAESYTPFDVFLYAMNGTHAGDASLREGDEEAIFISNNKKFYGASVIFYDGVLKKISGMLGGNDYLVVPCSVHELMCIKCTPEKIREGVIEGASDTTVEMNECIDERDVLSDNVYYYEVETGNLVLAKDKL